MRIMILALAASVAWLGSVEAQQPQRPPQQRAETEWRPDWAKELPYIPPAGSIGLSVYPHQRNPCQLQIYIGNNTDRAIREIFGVILVHTERDAVVTRFHLSFIDPNVQRGGGSLGTTPCTGRIIRAELREVSPCSHDRPRMRGCGAPIVAIAPRMNRPTDIIPLTIAPDYNQ